MGAERLENAAAAAGFAMVNSDDFAGEATPVAQEYAPERRDLAGKPVVKTWLSWDYFRLAGGKATA